jgi:hypothetical protein
VETRGGRVQLSVIAFFSDSSDPQQPTCDGFFQYIPLRSQVLKWTHAQGEWRCQQTGVVKWFNDTDFRVEKRLGSCHGATEGAP